MRLRSTWLATLALSSALAFPILTTGCAEHHYRYYDSYYHDYHHWNAGEEPYYRQWATDNHRNPNREFRHLDKNDQERYWQWRHHNGPQDRNHDHDHDHDHDHGHN